MGAFIEAAEGGPLLGGKSKLTQNGADELNHYRALVANWEQPTALEMLAYRLHTIPVGDSEKQNEDQMEAARLLELNALDIKRHYPGRSTPKATEEGYTWIGRLVKKKEELEKQKVRS